MMASKPSEASVLLWLGGIKKRYGGIQALAGVDLEVRAGEIHAVCGENGAGKSTLMKIVAGAEQADSGSFEFEGRPVFFKSVADANRAGIAIVFQELSLFPDLDAVANIFVGREPQRFGLVNRKAMEARARPLLSGLGLDIQLDRPIGNLRIADQQLVEVAKAIAIDARLLILDEPNSALNAQESARLFAIVRKLRDKGVGILFISHRLEEVLDLSDRVTVFRNGHKVSEQARSDVTMTSIVTDMLGEKDLGQTAQRRVTPVSGAPDEDECLRIDGVSLGTDLMDFDLVARKGETIGLAGLDGSGLLSIFDLLFGRTRASQGTINLPNGQSAPRTIPGAVRAGIALIPGDRRTEGLSLEQDILSNLNVVVAGALSRFGSILSQAPMAEAAQRQAESLRLVFDSFHQRVGSLSGGNQQKVVIGKWLEADPAIILLNDPTRGVDVGAKKEIYRIIEQQAQAGKILLFHSSELTEFSQVCDRVIVFYQGRAVGEVAGPQATDQVLLEAINVGRVADRLIKDGGEAVA